MRATRHLSLALALTSALATAACGDDVDTRAETYGLPSTFDALKAHEWVLDRAASTPAPGDAGGAVTLAFGADEVTGTGPCNGFRADLTIHRDEIELSGVAQTLRSCGDAVDAAETEHFRALERVERAEFDDDDEERLVLTGPEGVRLVYDAYDADEELVGEWVVVDLVTDGDRAIASLPAGVEPLLVFDETGDVSVTGLCNTLASSWELAGDRLVIDPPVSTLMACEPAELMETETILGGALERIETVAITPDTLTAYDSTGGILLVAVARPA